MTTPQTGGEPSLPEDAAPGPAQDAVALLLDQCARTSAGRHTDPALVAAVVGVERVADLVGSRDTQTLRAAVTDGLAGPRDSDLGALLVQLRQSIALALSRPGPDWKADATVLNPATGGHHVATDLDVLRTATRAATLSYGAAPYYRDRYGRRGAQFSVSDSAWIAHLADAPRETAAHQVTWLSTMLTHRGMPTWLMERHLATMVDQLGGAGLAVGALPHALTVLEARRRAAVDDDLLEQAETWVRETVVAPPTAPTGRLVAAAVADVRSGVAPSSAPLMDWLTHEDRTDTADASALRLVHDRVAAAAGTRTGEHP